MSKTPEQLCSFDFKDFFQKTTLVHKHKNQYSVDKLMFELDKSSNSINCGMATNIFSFSLDRDLLNKNKEAMIICSKDNSHILDYSLNKLKNFDLLERYDILLVDDRSKDDSILKAADKYNTSYLRIDNSLNIFNYGVINNIATAYCEDYKNIIFYNNDLWPESKTTIPNIVQEHKNVGATITGCKLVYPSGREYEELGKPVHLLQDNLKYAYGTIQHGGVHFTIRQSGYIDSNRKYLGDKLVLSPDHTYRYYPANNYFASQNNLSQSVTGALHVVNTEDFFDLNGLNVGMSVIFQDIDLCVKALEKNCIVYYVGTETCYHAESLTNAAEKASSTPEFSSDHIVWDLLWGVKLPKILGYRR
jgi:GT2 family glycosyltransferase